MQNEIVTLDGPAGAGKSTVAKLVAKQLGFKYLDTGATYRATTLSIIKKMISIEDKKSLINLLDSIKIDFDIDGNVLLDNERVTNDIRTKTINSFVSQVSALQVVREYMVNLQRRITESGQYVVDGRDIGTVVLPNAFYKFYIDADVNERARRRHEEEISKGIKTTFEEVKKSVEDRDKYDSSREISPLTVPHDADVINTSIMSIQEVVTEIVLKVNYIKHKNIQ